MQIEESVKLDFDDVLIRPKRSKMASRSKVELNKKYKFLNSQVEYQGIPIIAANMSCVGTFAMAEALAKQGMMTALHKHYPLEKMVEFYEKQPMEVMDKVFYTMGISDADFDRLDKFRDYAVGRTKFKNVSIDVANGYTEYFQDKVKEVRRRMPEAVIMAGNVATREMVQELLISGAADIIKIGIGSGCFDPNSEVITKEGKKKIIDIIEGEEVLTHKGRFKRVVGRTSRKTEKTIVVNGIKCTPNHEFYVLNKIYLNKVENDENKIHHYAEWVEAKDLTKNYLLLKINEKQDTD